MRRKAENHIEISPELYILPTDTPPLERILAEANNDAFSFSKFKEALELKKYPVSYLLMTTHTNYALGLHWVYKRKWNDKHKIPKWQDFTNEGRNAIKVFGEMLLNLLELCIQVHPLLDQTSYKNAGDIFVNLVWELKQLEMESKAKSKIEHIKTYQEWVRKLRSYTSPFEPHKSPHLHSLISLIASIYDSSACNLFIKNYYVPFVASISNWIKELKSNPKLGCIYGEDKEIPIKQQNKKVGVRTISQVVQNLPEKGRAKRVLFSTK